MAFKMNRSIIKGTPMHQKAKAKAKSIVAKGPVGPDAGLVEASRLLGQARSRTPNIDFTMKPYEVDYSQIEFGERKPRVKKERKKFKLGEKIGDFFVSKAGKIRDAAGNILSGIEERRARREIERQNALAEKREKDLDKRLAEAEEGGLTEEEYYSQMMEQEPTVTQEEVEEEGADYYGLSDEELALAEKDAARSREKWELKRNAMLQEAAKKYNVRVEDLEAKELGGKREFFPKQGSVGGPYAEPDQGQTGGTQWDDELGRFKIPSGGLSDEAVENLSDDQKTVYENEMDKRKEEEQAEFDALKPKTGDVNLDDINSTMISEGQVELDPVTNTYKYTDLYHKTQAIIAERNKTKSEPVVEEKKTTVAPEAQTITPKQTDSKEQKALDRKYIFSNPTNRQRMIDEGYIPKKDRSPAQMRDDRIFNGAIKGGKVQQNMIKSGYIPR